MASESKFNLGNPGCKRENRWNRRNRMPPRRIESSVAADSLVGGLMETLRSKSFWGAMVFVAVFVTSIVVLLADNAMSR